MHIKQIKWEVVDRTIDIEGINVILLKSKNSSDWGVRFIHPDGNFYTFKYLFEKNARYIYGEQKQPN